MPERIPMAVAGALLLAGCSGGDGPRDLVEVRDSAGVRVVYSTGPQWGEGEGWSVASNPSVVIGKADGEESEILYRTGPALRLGNGEVLVVQSASPPRLRIYDERGGHVRTFGGEGEGPGEFRLLGNVCVTGDTVTAYDPMLGRLTAFDLAGEVLDVRGMTPLIGETGIRRGAPVWMGNFGDCDRVGRPGRAHETVPIGEDDIRRVEEHQMERADPASASYVRETLETAVYADAWPVHTRRMVVDRAGNLWVHHFVRPWEEIEYQEWSVFDVEGVFLGEVRTPRALRVTEIGDDYVLGVWRDSLDVESVRLFTLDKGRVES